MVDIDDTSIAKLVNHAKFEQGMAPNLTTLSLLLSHFVDRECLCEVLKTCSAIVHEVCNFQTGFIFSLFLVQRDLQVSECKLLV